MSSGWVFPGQGSQKVGMGKGFYDAFPVAREVFEEVDDALQYKLSDIIFNGPIETLTATNHTQPALMAVSIAIVRVILSEGGTSITDHASMVAGHSLGEYSALCAAGALSLTDTAALLVTRGNAMLDASPEGVGGMAAILGAKMDIIEEIVATASQSGICVIANDNSPGQVVISGDKAAVEEATLIAKEKGIKRAILLPVSGAFHSPLMDPAKRVMQEAINKVSMYDPIVPIIQNISATQTIDTDTIKQQLTDQVTGKVRWRESVETMQQLGMTRQIEIGSANVLTGLCKRITNGMEMLSIAEPADLDAFFKQA